MALNFEAAEAASPDASRVLWAGGHGKVRVKPGDDDTEAGSVGAGLTEHRH